MASEQKKEKVKQFTKMIDGKAMIFFNYQGINVADLTAIRGKIRDEGGQVKVMKNNLLKIALKNININPDDVELQGMFAVAITDDDHFTTSGKVLLDAEGESKVEIRGGYYEGNIVDIDYVKKMSSIPARETLFSMLVGSLQGPISDLVFTLQGVAEKKEEN